MPIAAMTEWIVQAIPLRVQGQIGFDHLPKVAYTPLSVDLDDLITEEPSDDARDLDLRGTRELLELMAHLDAAVPPAVEAAAAAVAEVVDGVVERLESGGRLIYVGAGSSGRQAVADAAECEATFSTPPGQVVAVFAGDDDSAEDDAEAGVRSLRELGVSPADAVIGVSASGTTPYVLAALEAAAGAGAFTACVVSAPGSPLARIAEREILVVVGPELIAGSTRLKAGTAQKLVLNQISTVSMIRLGKVFDNLMVDVAAGNEKLRARARRIVQTVTGASSDEADEALAASEGSAKVAIVSLLTGLDAHQARSRLAASGGNVRPALEEVKAR
jgi:N-acetylmuramic acid 6-phosphate etherase